MDIAASHGSSETDFDFIIGKWNIRNRKLKTRLNKCDEWAEFDSKQKCGKILNSFGNQEFIYADLDGVLFEGMSLRIFSPETKLWSIYWADSVSLTLQVPQVGSFENGIGEFYARDIFEKQPVIVKFLWDASDKELPVWSQAFSADEGKTWEWNWYMHFSRRS